MNASRLKIISLLLSLMIFAGCHASKSLPPLVETTPAKFKDLVPAEPPPTDPSQIEPHPLTLVVNIDPAGKLMLNHEPAGTTENTRPLFRRLKKIIAERERNRVYEPGGEEEKRIAKAVFVRAPRSMRYVSVVKVINAIKAAGSSPIGLQVDDLK